MLATLTRLVDNLNEEFHSPYDPVTHDCPPDDFIVLKKYSSIAEYGNRISRIAAYFYYVSDDIKIEQLAFDLTRHEQIPVVGVVDQNGTALGVILRTELFNVLGKPYGWDVYKKYTVQEIMKQARVFFHDRNIFSVAEEIKGQFHQVEVGFFLLTTHAGKFAGIFSTTNILYYLSEITTRDIALARRLHRNIVREQDYVSGPTFEFMSVSIMAKGIGGDFYVIKKITQQSWLLGICDVCGKGIAASLITGILGGIFNLYNYGKNLSKFISDINNYFFNTFGPDKFITGSFLLFNEGTGDVICCDMGHSYIYLLKESKIFRVKIKKGNLPLGVLGGIVPQVEKIKLTPGDAFLLHTDGIVDQLNPQGDKYPLRRFTGIMKKYRQQPVREIQVAFLDDFHSFRGSQPQDDDASFILLHYKGKTNPGC